MSAFLTRPPALDRSPVSPAAVLARGARWSRWVVAVGVALGLAAHLLPAPAYDVAVAVVVGLGLLAGLPHGAVDHLLAASLTGCPIVLVGVVYAAVAAGTWVLLAEAGTVVGLLALATVLALSVAHFGLGELEVLTETTGWLPRGPLAVAIAGAGTGALLLPLARAGGQLGAVAGDISPVLGSLLAGPGLRAGLATVWALAAAVAVVGALRAGHRAVALDLVLVGLLGALAPPLAAFAIWFGGWHSLRHCARLLGVAPASRAMLDQGREAAALGALARTALAPSLAAVGVLMALLVLTLGAADPAAATAQTLLVLLALTVPHMVVVLWLDRRADQAHAPA